MLDDYKKAVIFNYHEKKEKGLLSLNLSHPSPAKLREECLNVLRSRFDAKDLPFIKEFFNSNIESSDYSHSIKRFDADRFRPLVRFMRSQIEDTADRNIELLAWLIDFEPRPYRFGVDYPLNKVSEDTDVFRPDNNARQQDPAPTEKLNLIPVKKSVVKSWINNLPKKKAIPLLALIFLTTGGTYLYRQSSTVYICNGGTGKRYHLNSMCPSLKNCGNNAVSTTLSEAKKNGKTLCGWEK